MNKDEVQQLLVDIGSCDGDNGHIFGCKIKEIDVRKCGWRHGEEVWT